MIHRLALLAALFAATPALAQGPATNAMPTDPAVPSGTPLSPAMPAEPLFAPPTPTQGGAATAPTPAQPPATVRQPRRTTTEVTPELRAQRRERFRARLAQMTPEQREAFLERIRERRAARGLSPLPGPQ
jgi:hypothetical protein